MSEGAFIINKDILQNRKCLHEDTIEAIRMVEDVILLYYNVEDFPYHSTIVRLPKIIDVKGKVNKSGLESRMVLRMWQLLN